MEFPKEGDKIEFFLPSGKTKMQGVVMPCPDKKLLMIKQADGYNICLERKKVKGIAVVKDGRKKEGERAGRENGEKEGKFPHKKGLPVVSILQVGGTIVNKVDYSTGAVATKISPEEFLERVPGLEGVANIEYRKIANIASEDLRFGHYNLIAREVMKEVERGAKGVVITHGTDTMHFTSAAMSFILGGIKAPVILVGAQRSGDRGSSDGIMNLACAVNFIVKSEFNGVGICMHKDMGDEACVILPGVKARKMHTSRRDAFRAINSEPIAEVSREGKVSIIGGWKGGGEEKARWFKEGIKVGIVRAHTNLFPENISCFKGYKGLILEGTGLGHFPAKKYDKESSINAKIGEEIESLAREGCVVGITSQCVFGRVNLKVYTPQRELEARGVIGCEDMTTETAFIKLAWLLSNFKPKEAKEKMVENLRGEISQKSEIKKDFLE